MRRVHWYAVRAMLCAALALCTVSAARAAEVDRVDVTQRVHKIVEQQLANAAGKLDDARPLSAYGMDELDLVEMIMALEEEFDISIPDQAVEPKGSGWQDAVTTRLLIDIVIDQLRKKPEG